MLVGIAAVSAFFGALLLTLALLGERSNPLRARMRTLAAGSQGRSLDPRGPSFSQRVIAPLMEGLGSTLVTQLPSGVVGRVREVLAMAGQPFSLTTFLSLSVLSGLGAAGLLLALLLLAGAGFGLMQFLLLLVFALLGLVAPYYWLRRVVRKRQHEIEKGLPNALDLITTCVEAGLGLDAAYAKVAEKVPGPFSEELARALREGTMGRSRREALLDISRRAGVPEVTSFINAIVHAQATGSNVGDVLRTQAEEIRRKHRQRIEQAAQKMPIWMSFPLVLCLLPSLFVIILGPAVISTLERLG